MVNVSGRKICLIATDILLLNAAVYIALIIRFEGTIPLQYINIFADTFIITTILKVFIYKMFSLYASLWSYASIEELMQICFAVFIGSIAEYLAGLLLQMAMPTSVYVISFGLTLLFVGGSRLSYRILRRFKRMTAGAANDKIRVMMIGAGEAGAMALGEIKSHDRSPYIPVVVVDDDRRKHGSNIHGVPVKGGKDKIVELAERHEVQEIIVAMPSASKQEIVEILNICKKTKCKLKILPGIYELINQDSNYSAYQLLENKSN